MTICRDSQADYNSLILSYLQGLKNGVESQPPKKATQKSHPKTAEKQPSAPRASVSFYISPSSNKALPWKIFAVLYSNGKRKRFYTGEKVNLTDWSEKQKRCLIYPTQSDITILNNHKANETIKQIELAVLNNSRYICAQQYGLTPIELTPSQPKQMAKKPTKKPTEKKTPKAVKWEKNIKSILKSVIDKNNKELTKRNIISQINAFCKFLGDENITPTVECLNYNTLLLFQKWQTENKITNETNNTRINTILFHAKKIARDPKYNYNLDNKILNMPKLPTKSKAEADEIRIALTHEEMQLLEKAEIQKDMIKATRDVFLLLCYCGVRFEDLKQFLDDKNIHTDVDGNKYISFVPQKTEGSKINATIPLEKFYKLTELREKVKYYSTTKGYKSLLTNWQFNRKLKELFNLIPQLGNKKITRTFVVGDEKIKENTTYAKSIHAHNGRHTLITNLIRYYSLSEEDVIYYTGHADIRTVHLIYSQLTAEDRSKKALSVYNNKLNTEKQEATVTEPTVTAEDIRKIMDETDTKKNNEIQQLNNALTVEKQKHAEYKEQINKDRIKFIRKMARQDAKRLYYEGHDLEYIIYNHLPIEYVSFTETEAELYVKEATEYYDKYLPTF